MKFLRRFFARVDFFRHPPFREMEGDKRFQHAQYLIGFMNNYSLIQPESQEVTILCRGGVRIRTYVIILASVSEFLRKVLSEFSNFSDEDPSIVVPDLDPNHLNIFSRFHYIFN